MLLLGGSERRRSNGRLPYSPESLQHSFSDAKTCRKYGSGRFKVVITPAVERVRFFFCFFCIAFAFSHWCSHFSSPKSNRLQSTSLQPRVASAKGRQNSF